ncbi:beta-galactosidase [Paenibacillus soyae]|uniref:Beta-galactosidase n=1 Tax=Paenibacillus soyae TaxID=2969249 RepID=A0A9X2MPW6_9BACL|nr:beta-galactosidase [Paenibacillus soyae]MCR2804240.1 beta-galactosidase [Paenibacillus soyae]
MESNASAMSPVHLSSNVFRIQGKSEIVLCASLFYFRIPRALWRERMLQLKSFGYNCIDVYFPWNYHEQREGEWDFSGEKDIRAFLETASEVGLRVLARPGPYICSEWDGGALPAYLYGEEGMAIRDNNPAFLRAAAKWFDRIIPILSSFQIGGGGTIVAVQLDNELDFFGCADPLGYISALRDMAVERGITVPLIACAGQGGLLEASGLADGVVPTCNFYPNDRDPAFEEKVGSYQSLLEGMGHPLLVTETNRSHFLLRRLLSRGAKLLGPYLQVSGTDFGFTNATNNWGKPLAFLTSDYDFGGMISPEGHVRPEAYEGRLMARMIAAYGASLAEAEPAAADAVQTIASPREAVAGCHALKLRDGGYLGFVSSVADAPAEASFEFGGMRLPQRSKLVLNRWRSVALPLGVPLRTWGIEGTLLYATAELCDCRSSASGTTLVFHTDSEGEIALRIEGSTILEAVPLSTDETEGTMVWTFDASKPAYCKIALPDGKLLQLIAVERSKALMIEEVREDGEILFGQKLEYAKEAAPLPIPWSFSSIPANKPIAGSSSHGAIAGEADFLEVYGIYRGYAWYETKTEPNLAERRQGILVRQASDVISLYAGNTYISTIVPGGSSRYVPLDSKTEGDVLTVRAEIWGHSNFDDIRLPSLRLHAMKGLKGLVSVTNVTPLRGNWRVKAVNDRTLQEELVGREADDSLWPIVGFGGWLSAARPALEYYRNSFAAASDLDSWTVHFDGIEVPAKVYVDGNDAGPVTPSEPFVDITSFVKPGEQVQLTVFVERLPGLSSGRVILYEGVSAKEWRISSCQEEQLLADAGAIRDAAQIDLPLAMKAGEMAWLLGEVGESNEGKGWRVKARGSNLKMSVLFGGQLVGRLWLQGSRSRPAFTGGSQDSFYLPGPWFQEQSNRLAILLEALDGEEPALLQDLSFIPV